MLALIKFKELFILIKILYLSVRKINGIFMNSFRSESSHWRRKGMTPADYEAVEEVLSSDALLEMSALCLALEEDCCQDDTFSEKVNYILDTPGQHLESSLYLVYHKCATLEKAQALFEDLKKKKNFNAKIPSGLSIYK